GRPGVPAPPNPGPAQPNPQPWQPGGGQPQQPWRPGNPGSPNPGQPGFPGQPGRPGNPYVPAPPTPWAVQNPLAGNSHIVPRGVPVPIGPIHVPKVNAGPEWARANDLIRSGNVHAAQQVIDAQLQKDRSLGGMMGAVSAYQGANISNPATIALRSQTL